MRVLSNEELDEVYGGGDTLTVTTLTGYRVSAMSYSWSSPGGSAGFMSGGGITGEAGSAPCQANYYRAVAAMPAFNHIRCLASKFAHPGMELSTSNDLSLLNAFTYVNRAANGRADLTQVYVTDQQVPPDNYSNMMYGLTNHGGANQPDRITLTAGATTAKMAGSINYTSVTGETGLKMSAPWNGEEFALMVVLHEAAHTHGLTDSDADELKAWGYAKWGLDQYRATANKGCP